MICNKDFKPSYPRRKSCFCPSMKNRINSILMNMVTKQGAPDMNRDKTRNGNTLATETSKNTRKAHTSGAHTRQKKRASRLRIYTNLAQNIEGDATVRQAGENRLHKYRKTRRDITHPLTNGGAKRGYDYKCG